MRTDVSLTIEEFKIFHISPFVVQSLERITSRVSRNENCSQCYKNLSVYAIMFTTDVRLTLGLKYFFQEHVC